MEPPTVQQKPELYREGKPVSGFVQAHCELIWPEEQLGTATLAHEAVQVPASKQTSVVKGLESLHAASEVQAGVMHDGPHTIWPEPQVGGIVARETALDCEDSFPAGSKALTLYQ